MSDPGIPEPEGGIVSLLGFLRRARTSAFARDAGVLGASQAIAIAFAVVQGIIVARILGPRSYGVVALIAGIPALIYVFFDIRSVDAAVRYLGEFAGAGRDAEALAFFRLTILADLAVSVAALAVVSGVSPWAAEHVVRDQSVALLLVVYAIGIVCHAPAIGSSAVLMTVGRYRALAALTVVASVVRTVLIVGLVAGGLGVAGAVVGGAIAQATEGVLLLIASSRISRETWGRGWMRADLAPLRPRYREILRFLFWSDLGSLLGLFTKQLDVVVVGYFAGPTQAGYYRLAKSVGSLPGVVISTLQSVTYQRFARLRAAGAAEVRTALRRVVLAVALPLAALTILAIPIVPFAVRLVAGPRYAPAAIAAQVFVALSAVWMLTLWLKPIALTLQEVRSWALTAGVTASLSIAGFLLVTPSFGFEGTAWARLLAGTFGQCFLIVYLARRYRRGRLPGWFVANEVR
jgi:O-antigen/teichoic acid export membrane protein